MNPLNGSSGRLDRTYTQSHLQLGCERAASTLPTRACTGWCIGFVGFKHTPETHLRDSVRLESTHGPTGIRTQGILLAKEALSH